MQDADAGAVDLAPERLAERDDAGLRRRVGRRGGEVRVARDARVVDDLAVAAPEHAGQQRTGEMGHRDEVDLEHRVDLVEVLLLEQAAGETAGVVDEQIDVRQSGSAPIDRRARGQVDLDGADLARAARRGDDRVHLAGRPRPGEQQRERLARQRLGDRAADAAVGAGDQRRLPLQLHAWGTGADLTLDHPGAVLGV